MKIDELQLEEEEEERKIQERERDVFFLEQDRERDV